MRKIPLALFLLAASPAAAQYIQPYQNVGGAQHNLALTISTALTVPYHASYAIIQAKGAAVSYTTDGVTDPTASSGMTLPAGATLAIPGTLLSSFRAISATGTLDVEYFK